MEIPVQDLGNELLESIEEISSLCEQMERTVDALIQRHGDRIETVRSSKALRVSVMALKRELLQHYLEYRSAGAPRRTAGRAV